MPSSTPCQIITSPLSKWGCGHLPQILQLICQLKLSPVHCENGAVDTYHGYCRAFARSNYHQSTAKIGRQTPTAHIAGHCSLSTISNYHQSTPEMRPRTPTPP